MVDVHLLRPANQEDPQHHDQWVDSDKALQTAKQHGLKGSDLSMGLVVMGLTGAPVWSVNGGFAEGDVSVMLNGNTGAVFRTQVISYK